MSAMSDSDSYLVTLPDGAELSFASVAKGCAAKYAAQAMAAEGVESAIISLGGNVQTLGTKPDGTDWAIAVQDPEDSNSYAGVLSVGEAAVVTLRRLPALLHRRRRDRIPAHNRPDTGRPAESDLLSVTIICSDGTLADALSTALYTLGESGAVNYYETWGGFDMVLITEDGRIVVSAGVRDSFEVSGGRSVEYVRRDEE